MSKLREIYDSRAMLKALVVKNLKGQYKNSHLGFLWQFITPAVSVILFYFVFTSLRVNSIDNYWVFLCAGMFPFTFMNSAITNGGSCITSNSAMIKKICFPREILVLAMVIGNLITFIISYSAVIILILLCGFNLTINIMAIIPLILLSTLFSTGTVLLLSSTCVYIRDLAYFITAFSRIIFWITPVFYTVESLTGTLSMIIWWNPLTWFIDSYQKAIYYGMMPSANAILCCIAISITIFVIGTIVFKKLDKGFAERV